MNFLIQVLQLASCTQFKVGRAGQGLAGKPHFPEADMG